MASLLTQLVARMVDVPVIDPRLIAHVDVLAVVTADETQAEQTDSAPETVAPVIEPTSSAPSATSSQ